MLASFHVVWATDCSARLYSFHAVQLLSNHLAWFLNGTTLLCISESRSTSLRTGWTVYKPVVHLKNKINSQHNITCVPFLAPKANQWYKINQPYKANQPLFPEPLQNYSWCQTVHASCIHWQMPSDDSKLQHVPLCCSSVCAECGYYVREGAHMYITDIDVYFE